MTTIDGLALQELRETCEEVLDEDFDAELSFSADDARLIIALMDERDARLDETQSLGPEQEPLVDVFDEARTAIAGAKVAGDPHAEIRVKYEQRVMEAVRTGGCFPKWQYFSLAAHGWSEVCCRHAPSWDPDFCYRLLGVLTSRPAPTEETE